MRPLVSSPPRNCCSTLVCPREECSTFVDTLFTALRTKSYLPYSATPSSSSAPNYPSSSTSTDGGIPIPLDGLLHASGSSPDRGRKRGIEQDEYDAHGPSKGARLNQDEFSRYGGRGDGRTSWGGRNDRNGARMDMNGARADFMDGGMAGMGMGMGMNGGGMGMNGRGGQNYRPPEQRRGICRDYHSAYTTSLDFPHLTAGYASVRQRVLCTGRVLQVQPWGGCGDSSPPLPRARWRRYAIHAHDGRRRDAFSNARCIWWRV